jgi:peptide/nickel transport system permease protein
VLATFSDARIFGSSEPLLAPSGYNEQNLRRDERLQPPTLSHPFGTDELGRDLLSRVIYGARVSVVIGFSAVAIAMVLATAIGVVSGYYGGWFDTLFQRLVDVWIAFPPLILVVTIVSLFAQRGGPEQRTFWIIIALAILLAASASRVVRGAVMALKHSPYIDAARALGATDARILLVHIFPNVVPVLIVLATLQLGTAILAEAAISFLGYGVPSPFPAWGNMLSLQGLAFMRVHPWLAIWPGLAIALAVYGFNVLGDALRDIADPRLRGTV